MTKQQSIYNVHVYREMRLFFPGVAAASPEDAARIASDKATREAQSVEDCDGETLAALVDIDGETEFPQTRMVDFTPNRRNELWDALLNIKRLAQKSGDAEADPFALLDLIAHEAMAAIHNSTKE